MTNEELQAIKARHAAATADKWELLYETVSDEEHAWSGAPLYGVGYYVESLSDFVAIVTTPDDLDIDDNVTENLTFIAAAHRDIPALVAEVERLQALVDAQRGIIAEQSQQIDRLLAGLVSSELQAELDEVYETLGKANDTIAAYELRDEREAA